MIFCKKCFTTIAIFATCLLYASAAHASRPSSDVITPDKVQGNCQLIGFYGNASIATKMLHDFPDKQQAPVEAIGTPLPLPPVITTLPGTSTVLATGGPSGVRPSGSSAYNPHTEDLVYINMAKEILHYNNANQILYRTSIAPAYPISATPVFLNNELYVIGTSHYSLTDPGFEFSLSKIHLPDVAAGQTITPSHIQSFAYSPLSSYFDGEFLTVATNGTNEIYLLATTNLIIISMDDPLNPVACWIDLDNNWHHTLNYARYQCLEYKSPGVLLAISERTAGNSIIEIHFNKITCTASEQIVYDLSGLSVSPEGWTFNQGFISSAYDQCNEKYYFCTLHNFSTSSSKLVEVDLLAGTHTEHILPKYLFGIEVNKHCCDCCQLFDDFEDLVDIGWQVQVDHTACLVRVSAPQFSECHRFSTNGPASWGDGTTSGPAQTPTTGSWTHSYSGSGTYVITVMVQEWDGATLCWELPMDVTVTLDCCPNPSDIIIGDQVVCRSATSVDVSLQGCNAMGMCQILRVDYYVKRCSDTSWPTTPYHSNPGSACLPVTIYPQQYPGESCVEVYAEIIFVSNCCNYPSLQSNIGKVWFCDPIPCFINNPNPPDPCQIIDPQPLSITAQAVGLCDFKIRWFYQGIEIPGEDGPSYQPPTLEFLGLPDDCYYDHVFSVRIEGHCGQATCSTVIRVYNEDAPRGAIIMNPQETLPLCNGEDATLEYIPQCTGEPSSWTWHFTNDDNPVFPQAFAPLQGAGSANTTINTNKLYKTSWYAVQKQNGGCPPVWIVKEVEVKWALKIIDFTASPDFCVNRLELRLDFMPPPSGQGCIYEIEWYKDGVLIHTSTATQSPAFAGFTGPPPGHTSLAGNYSAKIRDTCCPTVKKSIVRTVLPACEPVLSGPCYRCYDDLNPIVLTGTMIMPPDMPCPNECTFQWYELIGGQMVLIPGATEPKYLSDHAGTFIFESTCNRCVKRVSHTVSGCSPCRVAVNDIPAHDFIRVFPNPVSGYVNVQFNPAPEMGGRIQISGMNGQVMAVQPYAAGQLITNLWLSHLPAGVYFLQVYDSHKLLWTEKIIRGQ